MVTYSVIPVFAHRCVGLLWCADVDLRTYVCNLISCGWGDEWGALVRPVRLVSTEPEQ